MLSPAINLRNASRLRPIASDASGVSPAELAILFGCGVVAALAVAWMRLPIRLPGHAILYAVLPMAGGLALAPRHGSGSLMSLGAIAGALFAQLSPLGGVQPAALVGVLALGPAIDLAQRGDTTGWRIHLRFALAGLIANALSWAARYGLAMTGFVGGTRVGGMQGFMSFWPLAIGTFALCGAIAGLVSAAIWFRFRTDSSR
jgi:hypothetical protein